jgi:Ser/Thr protein kinase RdoA (MazF antagonist)
MQPSVFRRPRVYDDQLPEIASLFDAKYRQQQPPMGGLPNVTFKAWRSDCALAIRVCNDDYTTRQHLRFELDVLRYLHDLGFSKSPVVVAGMDGQELQSWHGYSVIATRFIEGPSLEMVPRSSSLLAAVGETTAELAIALRKMRPKAQEAETYRFRTERLLRRMGSIIEHVGWPVDVRFLWEVWGRKIDVLLQGKGLDELVVAHTDIWPPNILMSESGLLIVDFDDVALATPLLDLASALSEFAIEDSGTLDLASAAPLMGGYVRENGERLANSDFNELTAGICCSYITWLACDSCHSLDFHHSQRYYQRLVRLLDDNASRRLYADLVYAADGLV